jgi:GNAT superfamily N-acetyltransferase
MISIDRPKLQAGLPEQLADLVNDVYADAERGLWQDGAKRTTPEEMASLIATGEIVVARIDGMIVGSMRLHDVADDTSEFGILVAHPERRSLGIGRALIDHAEAESRRRGLRAIQLELLVPRHRTHPTKEFLKAWYDRRGYRLASTGTMDSAYPHLAPLLATPCDLQLRVKPLRGHHTNTVG